MMQHEEAHFVAQRFVAGEQPLSPLELVEHARAHLGVTEEVHLAARRNGARAHFADVVEERE